MENVHRSQNRPWISDKLSVKEFRDNWYQTLASSKCGTKDQFKMTDSEYSDLEEKCGLSAMKCPAQNYIEITKDFNIPEGVDLETLRNRPVLLLCRRCKSHINSNKDHSPPKAYWNNLDPGRIQRELQELTQVEIRLLARIKPFIKILKFDLLLGQYRFRAQAVLFAQDLHEVTEKLPNMLPRPANNLDVVIVTETLENLNISREFSIDRSRANRALKWLVAEYELYKDVVIDQESRMEESDYV
ncbi:uncharacterized protein TNIN_464361 [Trichonephila inaurata madagascariensis]|uniref:DUF6570 domain-containing protein n=1 Tax=Trichonephila inaurata madagascariensis TaxID=2747483 RepID=A0A8X6IEB7_9ARAC|nr:uncharacterized protein TNIN_464361 [Trichonephila inaurata madagascariensis]